MKKYLLIVVLSLSLFSSQAQNTLSVTGKQVEALFLQNNLSLIAERMNIELAEAEIIQAKLWDNPELSVSDLNLWSTSSQREDEPIPALWGDKFMKNTQFSIELSQLIQTANKRGRLIRREKVGKQIAEKEFEEFLRALKLELRQSISEILYLQNYITVLDKQQASYSELISSYKKLVAQGNLAKSELIRLQSAELEIDNEQYETQTELNEQLSTLKVLLNLEPQVELVLLDEVNLYKKPSDLILPELLSLAEANRPDVQTAKLQTEYFDKSLAYEKSLRVPDITLSAAYDRRGGVWRDFIGFGVSIDLPIFDRNQGGVKTAKINHQQSLLNTRLEQNKLQHEVATAYNNYLLAHKLYTKANDADLLAEITKMQEVYNKYLINKTISMLEYLDFMEAYTANFQTMLTSKKNLANQFQELQFTIGIDIE